jgi:hypothetical protein
MKFIQIERLLEALDGQRQLTLRARVLLAPQNDQLRRQPGVHCLESLDNGMAGGAERNHQPGLQHAGDTMMDHDPIAVLLCRPVETSLASPVVPP